MCNEYLEALLKDKNPTAAMTVRFIDNYLGGAFLWEVYVMPETPEYFDKLRMYVFALTTKQTVELLVVGLELLEVPVHNCTRIKTTNKVRTKITVDFHTLDNFTVYIHSNFAL